jgi:hypothetical protein
MLVKKTKLPSATHGQNFQLAVIRGNRSAQAWAQVRSQLTALGRRKSARTEAGAEEEEEEEEE